MKQEIVYIGGYGRSGSTLLDILIGEQLHSVGELVSLPRLFLEGNSLCTCGKQLTECQIWAQVFAELGPEQISHAMRDLQQINEVQQGWKSFFKMFLPGIFGRTMSSYCHESLRLYAPLHRIANGKAIVESSKTAGWTPARPALLKKLCGFQVKLIHLTRDPRGVYYSVSKGKNRALLIASPTGIKKNALDAPRALVGWVFANIAAYLNGIILGGGAYLHVRYEDLTADPAGTLRRIGTFLKIDLTPVIIKLEAGSEFSSGHLVGGNRMARAGRFVFRPDNEWISIMPGWQKFLIWLLVWPLAYAARYRPFLIS